MSGVTALVLASSPSANEYQALRRVRLHVGNAAGIPSGSMSGARREVLRLYSGIGVMLTWEEHEATDNISHQPGNETMLLRVTILRDAPRGSPGSETLGAASLLPGESRIASMYYSRVERAARRYGEEPGLVLGHAIAHEVAHLIIPQYGHSSEGLMKAVWDVRDYQIAAQGRLCFSAQQVALIRAALAR